MTAIIGGYPWRVPSQQNDNKPTRCFQLPDPADELITRLDTLRGIEQRNPMKVFGDTPAAVRPPNRAERRKSKWQVPAEEEVPTPVVFPEGTVLPWDTVCTACGRPVRVSTRSTFDTSLYLVGHNPNRHASTYAREVPGDVIRRILAGPPIIDDFTTTGFHGRPSKLNEYEVERRYAYARPVAA